MSDGRAERSRIVAGGATLVFATAAALLLAFAPQRQPPRLAQHPPLLPVPLVSQARPWTCGGAALMAALVYFGVFDDAESRLDAELGATPDQGTRVGSIVDEARRFGLAAEARTGLSLDDLDRELQRGGIVIVAVQAWASAPVTDWRASWEDGHYVVVVGLTADRVYAMDPSVRTGYAYLTRDQFLARWHDYELTNGRRAVYDRLGIVLHGGRGLARYPADPVPIR